MKAIEQRVYELLDKGLVPDFVLRLAVRALCRQRLREITCNSFAEQHASKLAFIDDLRRRSIAEQQARANEQHYEVPTEFILSCLGPRAKYSACIYPTGKETLAQAENATFEEYCVKAKLSDGQDVLDLGCGWGSLTLYLAEKYPNSKIVGISNSTTQREHILGVAKNKGFENVEIITADVNSFDFTDGKTFDRILSIEMFEHMKNYEALLRKVASWLRPQNTLNSKPSESRESLLFVHLFCHKYIPYHFEEGDGWMAQTFFSGGTMPSHDLLLYFQSDVTLIKSWFVNGKHYSHTLEDWLRLQDANSKEGLSVLEKDAKCKGLDPSEGRKAFYRFRVFYIACSEFFGLHGGEEWGVGQYLFKRKL